MKLRFNSLWLVLLFAVILYSCSSSNKSTTVTYELQTGDYTFSLWDSNNKILIDGSLTVGSITETAVIGTYKTTMLYDSTFSTASKLTGGNFTGKFSSKTGMLGFNMNPKIADNNVYFSGKADGDKITGDWTESTMMGTKNTGKFQAIKK